MQPGMCGRPKVLDMKITRCMRATPAGSFVTMAIFLAVALWGCNELATELDLYEPVIVFSGRFEGEEVYLPGNVRKPNTCTIHHDTIRMYFYSDDYDDRKATWNGEQLRIEIYPDRDSIESLGMLEMMMRLSRYGRDERGGGSNRTYHIGPADTIIAPPCALYAEAEALSWNSGGRIRITRIAANLHTVGGTGLGFTITEGLIEGRVE